MDQFISDYGLLIAGIVGAGGLLDLIAGYVPDKYLPYIGFLRRIIKRLTNIDSTTKKLIAVIIPAAMLISCAGIQTSKFCTSIPEGEYSVICEISIKVGTTPETVGTVIKVADLVLLDETHTAQQAYDFIEGLKSAALNTKAAGSTSYLTVVTYFAARYVELPAKVQAAIVIIKDFYITNDPILQVKRLSAYDWKIILDSLQEQQEVLLPFLPKN